MQLYGKDILMLGKICVRTIFYFMLEKGQTTMREFFSHEKCFSIDHYVNYVYLLYG